MLYEVALLKLYFSVCQDTQLRRFPPSVLDSLFRFRVVEFLLCCELLFPNASPASEAFAFLGWCAVKSITI